MTNREAIKKFVEVINSKKLDILHEFVHDSFRRNSCSAGRVNSLDELIDFLNGEFSVFPDAHEEILDMVSEGNKIAVRHKFTGTQLGKMGHYPPTGKTMNAEYMAIYAIFDGKIIESWVEWDNLTGLKQLGHIS